MWKFIKRNTPLIRAVSVVGSVAVLVSGVTFAALQSQQVTLTGNSIQSATAGLLIGTASATSTAYSTTHNGFTFVNVVPGATGSPADGNTFYLKNNGSARLALKLSVSSTPTNGSGVDLTKVMVTILRTDTNVTQTTPLQTLLDGYPSGGLPLTDVLDPASTGMAYKISVTMAADAFSGSSATVSGIDFVFSGTAVSS